MHGETTFRLLCFIATKRQWNIALKRYPLMLKNIPSIFCLSNTNITFLKNSAVLRTTWPSNYNVSKITLMVTITLKVYGKKSFSILTKSVFLPPGERCVGKINWNYYPLNSSKFHEPTLHLHNGVPLKNLKLSLYIAQWRALEKLDIFFIYRSKNTGNSFHFKFVQISYSYIQLKWFSCKKVKLLIFEFLVFVLE